MKLAALRAFALALPEVTEEPHHNYSSFRVHGKIFVTIPPDELHAHVFPSEGDRERFLATYPEAFEKLYWGSKAVGVRIHLPSATPGAVKSVVKSAHNYKTPQPKPRVSVPAVAVARTNMVKSKSPPSDT